jgi:hypothetical protein
MSGDEWIAPEHDPFQAPDAEPEADTRERVLADEEAAGDGEADAIREQMEREASGSLGDGDTDGDEGPFGEA